MASQLLLGLIPIFTYKVLKLCMSDTYIHLQGSQAVYSFLEVLSTSDTYIHLQGSQAVDFMCIFLKSLIPIFTYKVLKRRIRTRRRSSV